MVEVNPGASPLDYISQKDWWGLLSLKCKQEIEGADMHYSNVSDECLEEEIKAREDFNQT